MHQTESRVGMYLRASACEAQAGAECQRKDTAVGESCSGFDEPKPQFTGPDKRRKR
jgi:hypothetical protein